MRRTIQILSTLAIVALSMAIATTPAAAAPLPSAAGPNVQLTATLAESISVNVQSGTSVSFGLTSNTASNAGSTTSSIKTSWSLATGRTAVTVWAWVPNGAAALTDGAGDNIPASAVSVTPSGSGITTQVALNNVVSGGAGVPTFIAPAAATGAQIGNVAITATNRASSTTTTLTWNIDTTVVPQLPAATYNGTVNIQAQATP